MRRVSMATRGELVAAGIERYSNGRGGEKGRILDEFVAVTGFHRKHAMRVLRAGSSERRTRSPPERRVYDKAVREALIVLWEASDRVCGKRLKALAPLLVEAMERHGHVHLAPEVRASLLAMSAATIDRALRGLRDQAGSRARRRVTSSSAVRRSIPVRTFSDWQDPPPDYVEADLVAHSGPSASGSFVQTLVLTDIATGWTECAPLLVREQVLLKNVLGELRKLMPFDLLGFDTDNDSVFINETIRDYCQAEGTVDRGVPGGASHGLEGGGGQADGATQAEAEAWPAPAGPAHRGDDGVAGLVRRRSVANGTRVARAAAGRTSGARPRSAAANAPASAEGLAGRDGPDPRVRHRGAARARADAVDGHCAGMIVGNIGVRQRAVSSGAFLHEAIRVVILIVALHQTEAMQAQMKEYGSVM